LRTFAKSQSDTQSQERNKALVADQGLPGLRFGGFDEL
jgi:hypothetical protein